MISLFWVVLAGAYYDIVKFLVVLRHSYILPKRVGVEVCYWVIQS